MREVSNRVSGSKIELIEFDSAEIARVCTVASFGVRGTGKTRFAASYPEPIGIIPLDRKTRYTLAKEISQTGKKVIIPKEDFIRVSDPMGLAARKNDCDSKKQMKYGDPKPDCCAKHYYRWHANRVKEAAFTMVNMPISQCRSIVIDTGTQLAKDLLFACYGRDTKIMPRDRGEYNSEMEIFINTCAQKNLLITHKAKEIWKGEKPTGQFERRGWADIGYHCDCEIQHLRDKKTGEFYVDVIVSQTNPALFGVYGQRLLVNEDITFQNLALNIYEDSEEGDWV